MGSWRSAAAAACTAAAAARRGCCGAPRPLSQCAPSSALCRCCICLAARRCRMPPRGAAGLARPLWCCLVLAAAARAAQSRLTRVCARRPPPWCRCSCPLSPLSARQSSPSPRAAAPAARTRTPLPARTWLACALRRGPQRRGAGRWRRRAPAPGVPCHSQACPADGRTEQLLSRDARPLGWALTPLPGRSTASDAGVALGRSAGRCLCAAPRHTEAGAAAPARCRRAASGCSGGRGLAKQEQRRTGSGVALHRCRIRSRAASAARELCGEAASPSAWEQPRLNAALRLRLHAAPSPSRSRRWLRRLHLLLPLVPTPPREGEGTAPQRQRT